MISIGEVLIMAKKKAKKTVKKTSKKKVKREKLEKIEDTRGFGAGTEFR